MLSSSEAALFPELQSLFRGRGAAFWTLVLVRSQLRK